MDARNVGVHCLCQNYDSTSYILLIEEGPHYGLKDERLGIKKVEQQDFRRQCTLPLSPQRETQKRKVTVFLENLNINLQ